MLYTMLVRHTRTGQVHVKQEHLTPREVLAEANGWRKNEELYKLMGSFLPLFTIEVEPEPCKRQRRQ